MLIHVLYMWYTYAPIGTNVWYTYVYIGTYIGTYPWGKERTVVRLDELWPVAPDSVMHFECHICVPYIHT